MSRANTRVVKIGDRVIGGGNPILIQSMTNTKTEDVEATVKQIQALTEAGCDLRGLEREEFFLRHIISV